MGNQTGSAVGWLKDHEVGEQVASGGPNCQLKVFLGNRKIKKEGKNASSTPANTTAAGDGSGTGGGTQKGEQVSLWLFDKRAIPQQELRSLGPFCELLSRQGGTMSRGLKHANVLSLLSPLQETKEAVLLETEPIFSSLRNILKDYTNLASVPSELGQFELDPFEIKMAVQQLTKGLLFLHSSAQLCCINLKPETVFLTKKGIWKIASFEFALPLDPKNPFTELPFTLECGNPQLDGQTLPTQPYLEYLAPEIVYLKRYSANSDSFSLGCLIFELYTGRRLLQQGDGGGKGGGMSVATSTRVLSEVSGYKGAIERALYPSLDLSGLPLELHKPLQELLSVDPQRRLSIQGFMDSSYFNDIVMRSIVYLSSLPTKDPSEKTTFFKGLAGVIPKIPMRTIRLHLLGPILAEVRNPANAGIVLPTVLSLSQKFEREDFVETLLPLFLNIYFTAVDPPHTQTILEHLDLLLSRLPEPIIQTSLLSFLQMVLDAGHPHLQDLVIRQLPNLAGILASTTEGGASPLLRPFFPRLEIVCASCSPLRLNTLVCLGKLIAFLDKPTTKDFVLPVVERLFTLDRSPQIFSTTMSVVNVIVKSSGEDLIANKLIPFFASLSMDVHLEQQQFEMILKMLRLLVDRIETHRLQDYERKKSAPPSSPSPSSSFSGPGKGNFSVTEPARFEDLVAKEYRETDRYPSVAPPPPPSSVRGSSSGMGEVPVLSAHDTSDFHLLVQREERAKQGFPESFILAPSSAAPSPSSSLSYTSPPVSCTHSFSPTFPLQPTPAPVVHDPNDPYAEFASMLSTPLPVSPPSPPTPVRQPQQQPYSHPTSPPHSGSYYGTDVFPLQTQGSSQYQQNSPSLVPNQSYLGLTPQQPPSSGGLQPLSYQQQQVVPLQPLQSPHLQHQQPQQKSAPLQQSTPFQQQHSSSFQQPIQPHSGSFSSLPSMTSATLQPSGSSSSQPSVLPQQLQPTPLQPQSVNQQPQPLQPLQYQSSGSNSTPAPYPQQQQQPLQPQRTTSGVGAGGQLPLSPSPVASPPSSFGGTLQPTPAPFFPSTPLQPQPQQLKPMYPSSLFATSAPAPAPAPVSTLVPAPAPVTQDTDWANFQSFN